MDWILSVTSCVMLWLMGNKNKWAPIVGITNQVLWYVYALLIEEYGLLLGIMAFTVVHIRNLIKWGMPRGAGK